MGCRIDPAQYMALFVSDISCQRELDDVTARAVVDNTIDHTTSTFLIRAEVTNAEKSILPGEYVKVNAKVGEARDAIVVPEQAVVEGAAPAL